MRARLIVNPSSGADRAIAFVGEMNARLRALADDLDITITTGPDDAARAAARAVEERCDALFVAGGDGTLNAALTGLYGATDPAVPLPLAVGVVPFGTGNDFVKALDLGEDPEHALDAIAAARVIDVDLGVMNGRPFVNGSGGGFIADVSELVTEGLKDATGKLAYLIGGARALLGTEPFSATVVSRPADRNASAAILDAGEGAAPYRWEGEIQLFTVSNARFIGGGRSIAPGALVDDGELDVALVPRMPMLEFVGALQRLGSASEEEAGIRRFRAAAIEMTFSRRVRVNTDGELFEAASCRYAVRPRAVRFFCGPSPHALTAPVEFRPARGPT